MKKTAPNHRMDDQPTAIQAADFVQETAPIIRQQVAQLLEDTPNGLTDWQISQQLNILNTSAGKRRQELMYDPHNCVFNTGQRRINRYHKVTGKPITAIVWAHTKYLKHFEAMAQPQHKVG